MFCLVLRRESNKCRIKLEMNIYVASKQPIVLASESPFTPGVHNVIDYVPVLLLQVMTWSRLCSRRPCTSHKREIRHSITLSPIRANVPRIRMNCISFDFQKNRKSSTWQCFRGIFRKNSSRHLFNCASLR